MLSRDKYGITKLSAVISYMKNNERLTKEQIKTSTELAYQIVLDDSVKIVEQD